MPPTVCERHPETETELRCQRCDTPICPRCMVQTPVGFRCPD
ncbi:MAG: rhomboid family intramembrane serine protease, partial [Chloroflexi bacterium]|nr:rhomboid family intramembrane serine protease [Chloroflexota bacterium]